MARRWQACCTRHPLAPPKLSVSAIGWSYLAQTLNLTAGVVTLPVLFLYLDAEAIRLWIVFITLGSLALLFELGFQPTLARNVAYVLSGSREVLREGLAPEVHAGSEIDRHLLAGVVAAGRSIYLRLTLALSLLFCPAATVYLWLISGAENLGSLVLASWGLFALGLVLNFYFSYLTAMLLGAQEVARANQVTVLTRLSFIVLSVVLVISGFGLLALGIANLVACIGGRLLAIAYVHRVQVYRQLPPNRGQAAQLRRRLSLNAFRLGASQLGAFATQRGNILLAAAVLSVDLSAAYSLTVTALMALYGIALAAPQAALPFLGRAAQERDRAESSRLLGAALLLGYGTFTVGFLFLLVVAYWLEGQASLPVTFLSTPYLLVLGGVIFLELNHSIFGIFLTASNEVPFYRAAVLSGAAILSLSAVLVPSYGVWSLILVQGGVQLAYNNWRWPSFAMKAQGMRFAAILAAGFERLRALRALQEAR